VENKCTCDFCNDYCRARYFKERYDDSEYHTDFFARFCSRIFCEKIGDYTGTSTTECRKIVFCPSCGIKFNSKEFEEYYQNYLKENKKV
jgi:hypothetical protein